VMFQEFYNIIRSRFQMFDDYDRKQEPIRNLV
jgi:hypothetical protein